MKNEYRIHVKYWFINGNIKTGQIELSIDSPISKENIVEIENKSKLELEKDCRSIKYLEIIGWSKYE